VLVEQTGGRVEVELSTLNADPLQMRQFPEPHRHHLNSMKRTNPVIKILGVFVKSNGNHPIIGFADENPIKSLLRTTV
jgi:hypothetical protein